MEKEAGLVRGAEQRLGDEWTAVSVDDGARLQRSTADLEIIVDGFSGEVQKLDVDSCGQNRHSAQKVAENRSFILRDFLPKPMGNFTVHVQSNPLG